MANNYDSLKLAYTTLIAEITTDDVLKYKALILVDHYIDALEAQASLVATDVSSYSAAGMSVSRTQQKNLQDTVTRLERELNSILYGFTTASDLRGTIILEPQIP